MERPHPMDRLLCGDVGVGKTEVALRAAFKCIMGGKQCAILVPTTILAWQHYQTAAARMQAFPVKMGLLSRFATQKQMRATLRGLADGTVDLVVGTHRLLQKDVKFKFPMELVFQSQSQCILKPLEAKQSRSKRFISLLKKTSTSPLPT